MTKTIIDSIEMKHTSIFYDHYYLKLNLEIEFTKAIY